MGNSYVSEPAGETVCLGAEAGAGASAWEGLWPLIPESDEGTEVLSRVTRPHVCLKVTWATAWRMDWSWAAWNQGDWLGL